MGLTSYELALRENYGYLTYGEVVALHVIAQQVISDPKIVVNVGAGAGTSSLSLMEGNEEIDLYSVDNNPNYQYYEAHSFEEAGRKPPVQITDSSENAPKFFIESGIVPSVVFIDADHSYESVRADIEAWLPIIKHGGIIAFHDYGHPNFPGVQEAVDEAMEDYRMLLHVGNVIAFHV